MVWRSLATVWRSRFSSSEIRDLRHQVTQLTLAAAVLTQAHAETPAARPAPNNVVPLPPDKN